MANKVLFVFAAALCLALAARVPREEQKVEEDPFQKFLKNAEDSFKKIGDHIKSMLDGVDKDKLAETIKTNVKQFTEKAEDWRKQLETQAKEASNKTVQQLLDDFTKNVGEVTSKLRKEAEELKVGETAKELNEKFIKEWNKLVEDAKDLGSRLGPELTETGKRFEATAQKVIEDVVSAVNKIKDDLEKTKKD